MKKVAKESIYCSYHLVCRGIGCKSILETHNLILYGLSCSSLYRSYPINISKYIKNLKKMHFGTNTDIVKILTDHLAAGQFSSARHTTSNKKNHLFIFVSFVTTLHVLTLSILLSAPHTCTELCLTPISGQQPQSSGK